MLTRRRRRWAAAAVVAAVLGALWVAASQPWLPPTVGVAAAVLTRLLTRVRAYQPARATLTGLLAGGLVLLVGQSLWAWLLVAGTITAATVGLAAPRPVLVTDVRTAPPLATPTLRRSLLHWRLQMAMLGCLMAALGLVGVVQQHAASERQRAAQEQQASALARARLLPPSPSHAARALLQAAARDDTTACTTLLDTTGAAQLAATTHTTDCPDAIHTLAAQVINVRLYPQPDSNSIPTSPPNPHGDTATGDTATADTCHMSWNALSWWTGTPPTPPAGPQIGRLTLTRILGQGWVITDVQNC